MTGRRGLDVASREPAGGTQGSLATTGVSAGRPPAPAKPRRSKSPTRKAARGDPDRWWRGTTDLPLRGDRAGRFVPWLVGAMVFLATVALAGGLLTATAAGRLDNALSGAATIQIGVLPDGEPAAGLDERAAAALALARRSPGVIAATPVSPAAAAALIEPWLGRLDVGDLPLPRLIDVTVAPTGFDAQRFQSTLAAAVPGAVFDDHGRWINGLRRLAEAGLGVAAVIVALVGAVAAVAVGFATQSGLAVHRETIEVLHLIGARDRYIANGFARHALGQALIGGVGGGVIAAGAMWGVGRLSGKAAPGLIPEFALTPIDWAILTTLPPAAGLLAAVTAYLTVRAALRRLI